MANLNFLRFHGPEDDESDKLYLPQGLNYLPRKLILIEWNRFPVICLPSNFCTEYLVNLHMRKSKLHNLWEGNQPLGNLKRMDLAESKNLKELPDLSTATNLEELILYKCSSLAELPSSIGNLHKLRVLRLKGCSKLKVLPTNIILESLVTLDLTDCLLINKFPEISTNIKDLGLMRTAIKDVPSTIKSWPHLSNLEMSYNENLKELPHALNTITKLYFNDAEMQEIPLWMKKISCLQKLILNGCKKLVTLPQLSDSLSHISAENCDSLESLDFSLHNHPLIFLWFVNYFKLNDEAKEFIHQSSSTTSFLPCREVPANFTYRANAARSITVNLNERFFPITLRFKACILMDKTVEEKEVDLRETVVFYFIVEKDKIGVDVQSRPGYCFVVPSILTEQHLLTFGLEVDVTSNKILFSFAIQGNIAVIKECGVVQL